MCLHRDRNGEEVTYRYNMYHDPVSRIHKGSGLQEIYGYHKDGSLAYAIGGGMRYDYTYYPDGSLKEKKASGKTQLRLAYDLNGNKVSRQDITGKTTEYTYNALDLLEKVLNSQFTARYSYNSNGIIKSLRVGDRLTTHYAYDSDKNLTRQWTKMQGSVTDEKCDRFKLPKADTEGVTLLADYHYSYAGNGNRIRKDILTGSTTYAYDSLNRLAKVQYPKGMEEFTYDKADNRIRRLTEKEEELYKYDVCNRLVEKKTLSRKENLLEEIQKKSEGKKTVFQYDNQGNLLREQRSNGENQQESIYSYDGYNRQKKIVNFENKTQINRYDGEGLRHEIEENGKLVKFLYHDREAVAEEKEDGKYIRYIRGYDLIVSDSESARTYYHYASDEQGSITHVLGEDEDGEYNLKNYYEYGAFGDFREKYEEVENRFGYNGEIFDPIGGQYYLRARYYNPVIGRFTQEDTYYGGGLNLYAYCRNLPVGYENPSGHQPSDRKQDLYKEYREKGYKQDKYERWHKNGKYVSNAELGIVSLNDASSNRTEVHRKRCKEYTRQEPTGEIHHGLPKEFVAWFASEGRELDVNSGELYYDLHKKERKTRYA